MRPRGWTTPSTVAPRRTTIPPTACTTVDVTIAAATGGSSDNAATVGSCSTSTIVATAVSTSLVTTQ